MSSIGNVTLPSTAGYTNLSESTKRPSDSELEVQETFERFVGVTFFRQMLKSLRNTQSQAAYFHGGRAEEVFRGQLDEHDQSPSRYHHEWYRTGGRSWFW